MESTTVAIDEAELAAAIGTLVTLSQPIKLSSFASDIFLLTQADVDERFASAPPVRSNGVVYGGETWPALSNEYLAANPYREGGQQLRDEGELANSFQIGGPGNITQESPNRLVFGSALPKARGLQRDRAILFFHDELVDNILNLIALKIAENA